MSTVLRVLNQPWICLQSSDNISDGGDIVSGPYHPAFGQLVKSRIALRKLMSAIESTIHTEPRGKELCVNIPTGQCSDYIGQKKYNSDYIKNKFGFSAVKFYEQDYCKDFPEVFIRQ